jgi:hypothetical protein
MMCKTVAARSFVVGLFAFLSLSMTNVCFAQSPVSSDPQLTPAADFFKLPSFVGASISPQGKLLAFTATASNGRLALFVMDIQSAGTQSQRNIRQLVSAPDSDVLDVRWLNEERLVFKFGELDLASGLDYEQGSGLFVIKSDGTEAKQLIERRGLFATGARGPRAPLRADHGLLTIPYSNDASNGGNQIIVGKYQQNRDGSGSVTPLLLNVLTMQTESLAIGAPDNVIAWIFDEVGVPRVATALVGSEQIVYWRDSNSAPWQEINRSDALRASFTPYFVYNNQLMVLSPQGPNSVAALTRYDFGRNAPEATPLVNTPGFDFSGTYLRDRASGRILGLRVLTDGEQTVWFDPNLKTLQAQTDQRFPGIINRMTCVRCDSPDRVVLNFAYSDREPGQYWMLQGDAKGLAIRVGSL